MKALSIKQPWASLIAHGIKDIENRTWKTNFRGKIYIHASGQFAFDPKKMSGLNPIQMKSINDKDIHEEWEFLRSAIIGEVEIVDCVINHSSIWAQQTEVRGKTIDNETMYVGKPIWNWVLANAVLYDEPILNVKGKLSFWLPDIDICRCVGCSNKFSFEEMKRDESEELFCSECHEELFSFRKSNIITD